MKGYLNFAIATLLGLKAVIHMCSYHTVLVKLWWYD